MKRILIIGEKLSTLTRYLTQNNYDFIALENVTRAELPDESRRILCDFSSKEKVLAAVHKIKDPIDGIIATNYEGYILPKSWIAQELGLPGISPASAAACTDKYLMRSLFAKAPVTISPDFAIVKNEQTLRDFAASHSFPLILKPANLAKSLLVTKNHNLDELLINYRVAAKQIGAIYKKYAPNRTPSLLVEEFLHGNMYSVDAFTGADGNPQVLKQIVDYQTGYDVGFDDTLCYSRRLPSALKANDQLALRECAVAGIRALGIKNSPSHIEIIMTKDGPRIVEIGARNGGYREQMHWLANGLDITGAALYLALGQKPQLQATKHEDCAVIELYPKNPGIFVNIKNQTAAKKLLSLTYFSVKVKPGAFVDKAANGHKFCAVLILNNPDHKQFERDLKFIDEQVYVQTKPT